MSVMFEKLIIEVPSFYLDIFKALKRYTGYTVPVLLLDMVTKKLCEMDIIHGRYLKRFLLPVDIDKRPMKIYPKNVCELNIEAKTILDTIGFDLTFDPDNWDKEVVYGETT